jgi:uncharacterized glyoxalase superfamily protein PhnB
MSTQVSPIPAGYHTITPYLTGEGAAAMLAFLKAAFAAEVTASTEVGGVVYNAEARIGTSMVMVADSQGRKPAFAAMLYLYVPDVDAAFARAKKAGAKVVKEPETFFYGDRSGAVEDAWGNQWWLATRVENVSPAELERRMKAHRPG